MEQTIRHFLLLVFCQKNFLWTCESEAFFLVVFCLKIFYGDGTMWYFFSFCLLSTWGWERGDGTVWNFFFWLSFYHHPYLSPLPPKKFITWFQFSTISTIAVALWPSIVKKNYLMILVLTNIDCCHCPSPLPIPVARCCCILLWVPIF